MGVAELTFYVLFCSSKILNKPGDTLIPPSISQSAPNSRKNRKLGSHFHLPKVKIKVKLTDLLITFVI
jgi:hypothetical protein